MSRTIIHVFLLVPLVMCGTGARAEPIVVSEFSAYNALVFGDFDASISDVEGNAAVGGNLTTTDYSFGLQLDPSASAGSDVLTVKGAANLTRTRVYYGDFVHSGSTMLTNTGIDGDTRTPTSVDFENAKVQFLTLSAGLAQLPANGVVTSQFNKMTLRGTDPGVNVFNVTPDLWLDSNGSEVTVIDLDTPSDSTVIVNIAGAAPAITALGFEDAMGGQPSEHRHRTLFNAFEAEQITIQNVGLEGALLAPQAHLSHLDAVIYGQVVAGSFTGNGQIDLEPFAGELPVVVPEPRSLSLLLMIVGLLSSKPLRLASRGRTC